MEHTNDAHKVKPFTDDEYAQYQKAFSVPHRRPIRVGPKGYVLRADWPTHSEDVRTMPLRPDDIFVVSFPRSGTTWTQELVWLIENDMNFEKAKSIPLTDRYPFLEDFIYASATRMAARNDPAKLKMLEEILKPAPERLAATPSPRFIKSHLPLSLLPEGTLDTARVVYVARDPRDVAVSFYHFLKSFPHNGLTASFKEYYDLFINDLEMWSPIFEHVKEAWQQRHHPNMLFLFYEELSKDLGAVARRVADFLGKQYTDEQYASLLDHLKFDNFQKNTAVDITDLKKFGLLDSKGQNFIRKGKTGAWRDNFDEEMIQRTEQWMADNMRDTDLLFPQN
ncbi:sulfotransferase 1C4-like isoform X2 [Pectinophora gossypiella]|uniref:sulfotransferase 1C4-like isoform X1 n=1 Tax=Pectinophora gossypiella TaxID=13191 RepID=UPI00214EBD4B|nr:sulfotransferase 1C4-like isoform X1 [Pectinophora gossypiella]XP_049875170.1 sulfotransferase 1C4-like isoform X2 [Pectinophora gossypiella]